MSGRGIHREPPGSLASSRSSMAGVFVCSWLVASAHAAGVAWSQLPGLVEDAPATLAEEADVMAAAARTGFLGRAWQPRLAAESSWTRRAVADPEEALEPASKRALAGETGVTASLNLWRAGRDVAKAGALDAVASSRRLEAGQRRADRLLSARRAWLEDWRQQGLADLLAASIELTRANRERAARKSRSGLTPSSDVMEFDLRLLTLDQQVAEVSEARQEVEADLTALLGRRGESLTADRTLPDWPPSVESPSPTGLLELSTSGAGHALDLEGRSLGRWPYPELGLEMLAGQGGRLQQFPAEQQVAAGLGLTLALWDGGYNQVERLALVRQADALRHAATAAADARSAQLDLAAFRLQLWRNREGDLAARVRQASEFQVAVGALYLRGVKDSRDLEEATREVYEAGLARLDVRVRAWAAWAAWQAANAK